MPAEIELIDGERPRDPLDSALDAAQAAADDLLLHLQLAAAASYGPMAVIDAAMADIASRADTLAAAHATCRRTGPPRLADATTEPGTAVELSEAGRRLAGTVDAIEREAESLALELARRRADIDEVLRQAAGSPGIYDASGRTAPGAARRPRGTG